SSRAVDEEGTHALKQPTGARNLPRRRSVVLGLPKPSPADETTGQGDEGVVEFDSAFPADREAFEVVEQGKGVLDAGANLAVRAVVLVAPGREFSSDGCAAVRDEQAGAAVAADGALRVGYLPC